MTREPLTREEAIDKAKEEGATWMLEEGVVILFWKEDDEGHLTECVVVMKVDDSYRWLGWTLSFHRFPFEQIMERMD